MGIIRAHERGFSVLGTLIAIAILAGMGTGMAVLVSTNQELRNSQFYSGQAFASAQAGLEVTLGLIHHGANPCDPLSRSLEGDTLLGENIVVSRANSRIYITATKGTASTAVSITDPIPPSQGQYIQADVSHAKDASNGAPPAKLIDVRFQLSPGCGSSVTITSMVVSWDPNNGEKVQQIKFDGNNVYSVGGGSGSLSGTTIDIVDQTIADANVHVVDFIRWNGNIQNRLYTLVFNFADGSNKTATIDLR